VKAVEKYYSIHDIVNFKIVNNAPFLSRILPFWDTELRVFESERKLDPDFTIYLGRFSPQNSNCYILDDRFYIKEDYLFCSDSYKYARWELRMSGLEGAGLEVHISANPFAWLLLPDLIINPLIWFKLNEKGYAIVHGSGVVKEDRAYIFTGRGAAGKTTIALNLLERGFRLLGDHFVVLNGDAVFSFLSPLHIADFNLTASLRKRMKSRQKVIFWLNQISQKVTGLQFGTKIGPKTMFPGLTEDKARLRSVFVLLPRNGFKAEQISKEEFIACMIANQKLESIPFIKYMMEYSYLFPRSNMATHWVRYEENLIRSLSEAKVLYRLEVPPRYDNGTLNNIFEVLQNE
jgi:hypothetical protein